MNACIRNMNEHFKAFQDFVESLNFKFRALCLSENWVQPHKISDSNFQLQGCYRYSFDL